MKNYYLF